MTDLDHEQHPEDDAGALPDGEDAAVAHPEDDIERRLEGAAGASEVAEQGSQDALFTTDAAPAVGPETDEGVTVFGGRDEDAVAEIPTQAEGGSPIEPEVEPDAAAEWETLPPPFAPEPAAEAETHEGAAEQEAGSAPQLAPEADSQPGTPEAPVEDEPTAEAEAGAGSDEVAEPDAAAAAATEVEATLAEAGVPEGADDDADAVEALLDAETDAGLLEKPDRTLSTPFLVYDGIWLVFAIAMVVTLRTPALAGTLDVTPAYPMFVLVGLILTVIGPLLAVVLWWIARARAGVVGRKGLFASAFLRGALATFAGVAMWLVARIVLDFMRTGRLF